MSAVGPVWWIKKADNSAEELADSGAILKVQWCGGIISSGISDLSTFTIMIHASFRIAGVSLTKSCYRFKGEFSCDEGSNPSCTNMPQACRKEKKETELECEPSC